MTEHPLLFSAPMIRAILEGRKTVTRRLPKNPEYYSKWKKGDRVWVRETWGETDSDAGPCIAYRADNAGMLVGADRDYGAPGEIALCNYRLLAPCEPYDCATWKPSIHQPRWASRITLELTADVRREPLRELTEERRTLKALVESGQFVYRQR